MQKCQILQAGELKKPIIIGHRETKNVKFSRLRNLKFADTYARSDSSFYVLDKKKIAKQSSWSRSQAEFG